MHRGNEMKLKVSSCNYFNFSFDKMFM